MHNKKQYHTYFVFLFNASIETKLKRMHPSITLLFYCKKTFTSIRILRRDKNWRCRALSARTLVILKGLFRRTRRKIPTNILLCKSRLACRKKYDWESRASSPHVLLVHLLFCIQIVCFVRNQNHVIRRKNYNI